MAWVQIRYVRGRGVVTEDLSRRLPQSGADAWIEGDLAELEAGRPLVIRARSGRVLLRTSGVLEVRPLDGEIEVQTFRSVYRLRWVES